MFPAITHEEEGKAWTKIYHVRFGMFLCGFGQKNDLGIMVLTPYQYFKRFELAVLLGGSWHRQKYPTGVLLFRKKKNKTVFHVHHPAQYFFERTSRANGCQFRDYLFWRCLGKICFVTEQDKAFQHNHFVTLSLGHERQVSSYTMPRSIFAEDTSIAFGGLATRVLEVVQMGPSSPVNDNR